MAIGIGIVLFIIAALIIITWIINFVSAVKYKAFAIFLVVLIVFTYVSFSVAVRDQGIDLTTFSGLTIASKLYFSWLVSVFENVKTLTAQAIKLNWNQVNGSIK